MLVSLREGRNEIVALVENYWKEWGLYLRFADPDDLFEIVPWDRERPTRAKTGFRYAQAR